jgi:hypothetical protein
METGQAHFQRIQIFPQLLIAKKRDAYETDIYWSYKDALQFRQGRLDAAENDRRLHLPEQAAFWQEYKEKYPDSF